MFLDGISGAQPGLGGDTDHNLLFSRSDHTGVRGPNGTFINRSQSPDAIGFAEFGEDWTPEGPALVDRAGPIPDGWNAPDTGWDTSDVGCFQVGNPQPSDWPRRYDIADPYDLSSKHFETPRVPPPGFE